MRQRWNRLRARLAARELFGINRRNVELVYAHNRRRHYPIADDKLLGKRHLSAAGVPVPATLAVCEGLFAIPAVLAQLTDREHFVIKPANGSGGDGILVVGERADGHQWRRPNGAPIHATELQRHLANIVYGAFSRKLDDRAFVEDRIEPHPVFRELWRDGLCDVRILTLRGAPIMAMTRVPTKMSGGRANLHQGGIGLAVDLDTGHTVRAMHRQRIISRHPESGAALLGVPMPAWSRTLEVARRAAAAVPLGYLGVDIVVDVDRGPLVLEINARPGLEIQNVHGHGLGAAIARRMT
ncbi:sugar-transfer associated ATP-grasp domain-containing protein [Haliangium sp.]|uniref:sugar-transfer associated ATP-grasp domain-containing protein n=1 Tax=Haliangium sp. TaxID=2663208 RepID=UPI003D0F5299